MKSVRGWAGLPVILFLTICLSASMAVTATAGQYMAGLGAGMAPDYEGSDDYQAVPLMMFNGQYDSGRFFSLLGNNFKLNLAPNKQYHIGPVLQYRAERDSVDNDTVDRMKKVDATLEAGGFAGLSINNILASVQFVTDTSNKHDGNLATLSTGYIYKATDSLILTPNLSATYASSDYMQTYFGVDAGDAARTGLATYDASSDWKDYSLGLMADYRGWEKWGLVGLVKYTKLLNDAKHSPLVDDLGNDKQWFAGLMATYRWGSVKPAPAAAPLPMDSDGDGVTDDRDKCPNTPKGEFVDEDGCTLKLTLHINFDFDKADIKPEFKDDIDRAAKFIKRYPQVPFVMIAGHTDHTGTQEYNQQLSEQRAKNVRQYLIDNYGIEEKRLFARGFGKLQPVADNATNEGRYENRRVEVVCCILPPLD